MQSCGRSITVFLIMALALVQGVYGIQITTSGGGNGESGSVSMNFDTLKTTAVSSQIAINGATVTPSTAISGPIKRFVQTHAVRDRSGKRASVYVKVVNAPDGLTYGSMVQPKEGNLRTIEPWVSAEQWLTVPKADYIKCIAKTSYKTLSADVGIEETKGKSPGDYVTLTEYYGKAYASATQVNADQTATDGSGNLIKIYNHAKDRSGTYSIDTILNSGLYLPPAEFQGLDASSSAGLSTQVIQNEHIIGGFTSTAKAGKKTKTRTSNFGFEYDLDMQAIKGSSPTGILGYYVNPNMATKNRGAIQGAVNIAQSGDTINAAAGTYLEDVNINKVLTLKGSGNPTATSFTLNALLGTGSGGISAPTVTVNPNSRILDGILLSSKDVFVNGATGYTYSDDLTQSFYARGITLTGINNPVTKSFKLDRDEDGKIIGITANTVNVLNSNAKIQDGVTLVSSGGTVNVAAGTYNENVQIDKSLTLTGAGAGSTIVDGNQPGSVFTIGINNPNVDVAMSGLGITGGSGTRVAEGFNPIRVGGGIANWGTLNLDGVSITGNILQPSSSRGGGIYNSGTLTMNGGSITGNTAQLGGGILNAGTLNLNGGSISGNIANDHGGGIYNDHGTVNLNGGSISGNTARTTGGGIHNNDHSTLTMNGGSITENTASGTDFSGYSRGGGIYNSGTLTMNGGSITENTASVGMYGNSCGGGVYSTNSQVTFDGTQVVVKTNKAHLPDSESSWYQGWGVYLASGIPTTTGGFDPTTQVTDNVKI